MNASEMQGLIQRGERTDLVVTCLKQASEDRLLWFDRSADV